MKFPTGSIVTLKSGGPPMTVTDQFPVSGCECKWFVGAEVRYDWFEPACLKAADQPSSVIGAEHDIIIDRHRLADVGRRITTALRAQDPSSVLWVDLLAELESACRGVPVAIPVPE